MNLIKSFSTIILLACATAMAQIDYTAIYRSIINPETRAATVAEYKDKGDALVNNLVKITDALVGKSDKTMTFVEFKEAQAAVTPKDGQADYTWYQYYCALRYVLTRTDDFKGFYNDIVHETTVFKQGWAKAIIIDIDMVNGKLTVNETLDAWCRYYLDEEAVDTFAAPVALARAQAALKFLSRYITSVDKVKATELLKKMKLVAYPKIANDEWKKVAVDIELFLNALKD